MNLSKMYVKILLSFCAILFVTEILIFYLFVMIPVRHFNVRFDEFAEQRVMALKEVVEEKVRSAPEVPWSRNDSLKGFVSDFARLLGARIWLTDSSGETALASFAGKIPELPRNLKRERANKYFRFNVRGHKDFDFYAVVPIDGSPTQSGEMHILFDRQGFSPRKGHFAMGLAVIGFIIALAVFPVSRLITRRIKQLRESAIRVREGDLSHRVRIKGRDEIGELADAFNGMTERLEGMITSGRELTANVSHELRSPLARIRIAEEMLRERIPEGAGEDWARHLDTIREDIDELDRLIGRILELSKLEMHESPLQREDVDLSAMIRDTLEKLRPVMDRKELKVSTELPRETPFSGDREALRSALGNVLDNAVKFAPGKGEVSVRMDRRPGKLEVGVTNTFEKLSDDDLRRIFDPFHRTRQSPSTGSGLGLAIAKKAIERHGGSIEARNTEKGLEIAISLPLRS